MPAPDSTMRSGNAEISPHSEQVTSHRSVRAQGSAIMWKDARESNPPPRSHSPMARR